MFASVARVTPIATAFAGAALAIAASALPAAAPLAAEKVTLRFHTSVPPVSSSYRNFKALTDKMVAESEGTLAFEMYGSMQLGGKASDLYNQAKDGVVDMVFTLPGYTPGVFPQIEVFELPYIASGALATSLALTEFYPLHLKEEFKDVRPIVFWAPDPPVLHVRGKPIRTVEDMVGRKLRTPSRPIGEMYKALGAIPVGIPGASATEAVMRGVVDGAGYPWTIALATKLIDTVDSHTVMNAYTSVLMIVMNKKSYARLPAAAQKAIDANSGEATARWFGTQWPKDDQPAIARAKKLGHEIYRLSKEELARWKAKSEPVVADWVKDMTAKGYPGQALVDDARRLVAKHER